MKKIILFFILNIIGLSLFAQRPNMHLKTKIGIQGETILYKQDSITKEYFGGFMGGFGFRVMQKRKMAEIGFDFIRSFLFIEDLDSNDIEFKLNSFKLPVTLGYVTTKKPLVKHFLYAGLVPVFKVKSKVSLLGSPNNESFKIKPKDLGFNSLTFNMRFGTQLDIARFNIDFNYDLGLNKTIKETFRTQTHALTFTIGLAF